MANNYQQFSSSWNKLSQELINDFNVITDYAYQVSDQMIEYDDDDFDQKDQLLTAVFGEKYGDLLEWGLDCQYEPELQDDNTFSIWIYAEESGSFGNIASVICYLQKKYPDAPPFIGTWAATCSKLRVDEFSGGALLCYQGADHWVEAWHWAENTLKELINAEEA